jgi:hypothetical protein
MDDQPINIEINGSGLSFVKKINLSRALQIINFLGRDQEEIMDQSIVPVNQSAIVVSGLQPEDFIDKSGAKTYYQKITAIAKYLKDALNQDSFLPIDVRIILKKMGDEPKNFVRDFNKAETMQFIACTDQANGKYGLTSKGDRIVQNRFANEVNSIKRTIVTKGNKARKGVREEIKNLEVVGSLEGYPDYNDLPTKSDKILWLLEYSYGKKIEGLNSAEVYELSSKLRDVIDLSGFSALNSRNIKSSFVKVKEGEFQIQSKGEEYLKNLADKQIKN